MRRREFITLVGGATAWPLAAGAQKLPARIGFLGSGTAGSIDSVMRLDAVKQGLRENGLIENRDYIIEARFADGKYERFPEFANELRGHGVSVILVSTIAAARAAQRATSTIPIVMASINDPVGNGIVASLARPGGNTTGLATLNQDVSPKLIEIVRELLPNASAIAILFNPANPSNPTYVSSIRAEAGRFGITVRPVKLETPGEPTVEIKALEAQRPDALLVVSDAAIIAFGDLIAAQAIKQHLPVISTSPELTAAGGLVSYGASARENYRRSAYFIRRILDGAKPTDLPVEQPTQILLSVNLKTAKSLGLVIPPTLLARTGEVIE
jgi:putative ABC transport system substrate-binding protein